MSDVNAVWGNQLYAMYGEQLPVNYLAFDCETTGTDLVEDVPLEIGHCIVRNCKVIQRGSFVIDWTKLFSAACDIQYEGDLLGWFHSKVDNICQIMRAQGAWRLDMAYIREHGRHPHEVLEFYAKLFHKNRKAGAFFVGHNAWCFDVPLLETMFCRLNIPEFKFGSMEVLDTGGMEKAIQIDRPPFPDETMEGYFKVIEGIWAKGVRWSMAHCITKYDFVKRFGIDPDQTHQAEVDAYCCHLLYEEHRVHEN